MDSETRHPASDPPPGPVSIPDEQVTPVSVDSAVEDGDTIIISDPTAASETSPAPAHEEDAKLRSEMESALPDPDPAADSDASASSAEADDHEPADSAAADGDPELAAAEEAEPEAAPDKPKKRRQRKKVAETVSAVEGETVDEPAEEAYPDFFHCYPLPPDASPRDFEIRMLLVGLYTGRGGLTNHFI